MSRISEFWILPAGCLVIQYIKTAELEFRGRKNKISKKEEKKETGSRVEFHEIKPHKGMIKTLKQNRIFLNFSSNLYTLKSEIEEDKY